MMLTIEGIATVLSAYVAMKEVRTQIIDSIVGIRSDAYNQGWNDAIEDHEC